MYKGLNNYTKKLIDKLIDLQTEGYLDVTCKEEELSEIKQLLNNDADPNAMYKGSPILMLCCFDTDIAKILIKHGADIAAVDINDVPIRDQIKERIEENIVAQSAHATSSINKKLAIENYLLGEFDQFLVGIETKNKNHAAKFEQGQDYTLKILKSKSFSKTNFSK